MDTIFKLHDQILYGPYYPLMKEFSNQQKYNQLLHDLDEACNGITPLYQVNFSKSNQTKRQYFSVLVEEAAKRFLHHLHQEIESAGSEQERNYRLWNIFKDIDLKLKRTAVINSKGELTDDCTYEVQLLKLHMIRLYMEVQDQYKKHIKRNEVNMEDIYSAYFGAPQTVSSFIVKAPSRLTQPIDPPTLFTPAAMLQVRMDDIREPRAGVLPYEDIIAHKAKFAQLESILFERRLIDEKYQFLRKPQGNRLKMAAVYRASFQKGYYQSHYYKGKQRTVLNAKEVQAFLNHRYQVYIDKEFRNFNQEDVLDTYLQKESWISRIDME